MAYSLPSARSRRRRLRRRHPHRRQHRRRCCSCLPQQCARNHGRPFDSASPLKSHQQHRTSFAASSTEAAMRTTMHEQMTSTTEKEVRMTQEIVVPATTTTTTTTMAALMHCWTRTRYGSSQSRKTSSSNQKSEPGSTMVRSTSKESTHAALSLMHACLRKCRARIDRAFPSCTTQLCQISSVSISAQIGSGRDSDSISETGGVVTGGRLGGVRVFRHAPDLANTARHALA
jgi:hypothetical protein